MNFCWFTSFIGYLNFFSRAGHAAELAEVFLTLATSALNGDSYEQSKKLFPHLDPAQVETKKAAFQEFGLLYSIPRSNRITVTPLGLQLFDLCSSAETKNANRRTILFALCRALARYQFNNPMPVGGNRGLARAESSDVLPYLATYYLLIQLGGVLTVSEFRGAVFGLQRMRDLRLLEQDIRNHRVTHTTFPEIPALPRNTGTADNLKIYFTSHLSLDNEIITPGVSTAFYGRSEQIFELTEFGYELVHSVLDDQWPNWNNHSARIPSARTYSGISEYFSDGVGQLFSTSTITTAFKSIEKIDRQISLGVLDQYDIESLKSLPKRRFEEGRQKLIQHARIEKIRNVGLVRLAKQLFKKSRGSLFCEACGFDFEAQYGKRGKDYVEAHHRVPISQLKGAVILTVDDLVMVCSNCHRMLHRPPWITLEELRKLLSN